MIVRTLVSLLFNWAVIYKFKQIDCIFKKDDYLIIT